MDYLEFAKQLGYLSTSAQIENFSQDIAVHDILAFYDIEADVKIDPKSRQKNRYILTPKEGEDKAYIEYILETAKTRVHNCGYCIAVSRNKNNIIAEIHTY